MKHDMKGYGNLVNIPRIEEVFMVTIYEGTGEENSPITPVSYVYDKEFKLLHRYSPSNK